MSDRTDKTLQSLCRDYLSRLRALADRHGLGAWIDATCELNKREQCAATQDEVEALSRLCDDERVTRVGVSKLLGKSYRQCVESDVFDDIKTLPHVGIYSKVSALLHKD